MIFEDRAALAKSGGKKRKTPGVGEKSALSLKRSKKEKIGFLLISLWVGYQASSVTSGEFWFIGVGVVLTL